MQVVISAGSIWRGRLFYYVLLPSLRSIRAGYKVVSYLKCSKMELAFEEVINIRSTRVCAKSYFQRRLGINTGKFNV